MDLRCLQYSVRLDECTDVHIHVVLLSTGHSSLIKTAFMENIT